MKKVIHTLFNICHIEELARRDTWLNKRHSVIKILLTLLYIVLVASVDKYDLSRIIMAGVYAVMMITAGNIPLKEIGQKMIIPVLMGASLGVLNPLLDQESVMISQSVVISAGWISFLTIFLKSLWSVSAALILVSTTPIEEITYGLNKLKVPKLITVQLLLMFRYITILVGEIERILIAYSMRAMTNKGIDHKVWGSLIGQFFLRTSDRSIKLFEAMKLRGFDGVFKTNHQNFVAADGVLLSFWLMLFGVFIGICG